MLKKLIVHKGAGDIFKIGGKKSNEKILKIIKKDLLLTKIQDIKKK